MWPHPSLQQSLRADRRGVTALEYALVAGALSGLLVAAFTVLGGDLQTALSAAASLIPGA
jgi:Flp pilus assembly pilin Flp